MLKKRLGSEAIERDWPDVINCSIKSYFKILSILIIPEGVWKIGGCAFEGCEKLRKVIIPKSIVVIQDYAFWGCRDTTIILKKPKSEFEYIGRDALVDCKDVKEETRK